VAGIGVDRALRDLGRFDVILCPEWGANAWSYARRKSAGPLVTNLATSYAQIRELTPGLRESPQRRLRGLIQVQLERAQAENSDGILACSHAILDWARRLWAIEQLPTAVVPNFIDVAKTREHALEHEPPVGWPEAGPVVAFAGRVERRKGVETLLEAMRSIWSERPEVQLVVIGADTRDRGSVADKVARAAGEDRGRLHLLGRQDAGPLLAGLSRADVVALPSVWEAFGIVALEAMALGRAVVATSGSGFEEFIRPDRDGVLVPPRDAPALAEALVRLLDDSVLRERIERTAVARAEEFEADVIAPRYVDHFERVRSTVSG
jgi:glycosyltransferase involved in cell wall biosynthesis